MYYKLKLANDETEITLKNAISLPGGEITTLENPEGAAVTIYSAYGARHFTGGKDVGAITLVLNNVTLQGGEQSGGISCFNSLIIKGGTTDGKPNAKITGCKWELSGQCAGGVYVEGHPHKPGEGDLTIENCIVSDNSATMTAAGGSQGFGGGVPALSGRYSISIVPSPSSLISQFSNERESICHFSSRTFEMKVFIMARPIICISVSVMPEFEFPFVISLLGSTEFVAITSADGEAGSASDLFWFPELEAIEITKTTAITQNHHFL
ncbi:hypothetical protein LJC07_03525 [Christensenellaceae bacterium OttesenSCG-928-L17]|nr:hypothetical protein [Christensenellaceae bacterium OttesenSCG-928-L17]